MSTISAESSTGIAGALRSLDQALNAPTQPDVPLSSWWSTVRHHLTRLHDALVSETEQPEAGWLAAPRGGTVLRERSLLLNRLSTLGHDVLDGPEIEALRGEIKRLITDVGHYLQRVHDLAYDAVELELGGSE